MSADPPRLHLVTDHPTRAAEQAILGGLLLRPDLLTTLNLDPADYYEPRHETIHHAITAVAQTGAAPDPVTVGDRLRNLKQIRAIGGQAYLHELVAHSVPWNLEHHAEIVTRHANRRRLHTQLLTAAEQLNNEAPLATVLETTRNALENATPTPTHPAAGLNIDDFLAGEDDPYDWLIPDVLERTDRLIITASEGSGKSTLLRQLAVQTATGIHPFTGHDTPPIRVLLLDLENSTRQTRRKLRPLRLAAGNRLNPDNLIIECRIQGINLNDPDDVTWLDQLVTTHTPDLLITGPIYKMADGDPNDEQDSKPVVYALDALRAKHNLTLILEAHTKKAEGHDPRKRAKDPVGWSGWRRWPEFGLHLADDGTLTHWRGARDERTWPHQLNRGGTWPWTAEITVKDRNVANIKGLVRTLGRMPSLREIESETGIPRMTAQRLLKEHAAEFQGVVFWSEAEATEGQEQ